MCAYHAHTANALVNLIHLDTASECLIHLDEALAEAQHVWRNVRDRIKPPAPEADASLRPRLGRRLTPVGGDGDDEHPIGSVGTLRRSSHLV